jgi:hypothetical protein
MLDLLLPCELFFDGFRIEMAEELVVLPCLLVIDEFHALDDRLNTAVQTENLAINFN